METSTTPSRLVIPVAGVRWDGIPLRYGPAWHAALGALRGGQLSAKPLVTDAYEQQPVTDLPRRDFPVVLMARFTGNRGPLMAGGAILFGALFFGGGVGLLSLVDPVMLPRIGFLVVACLVVTVVVTAATVAVRRGSPLPTAVFAADETGVWYRSYLGGRRSPLRHCRWADIGWIGERRSGPTVSLVLGAYGRRLPGAGPSGQVRIDVSGARWRGVDARGAEYLPGLQARLHHLSGGRTPVFAPPPATLMRYPTAPAQRPVDARTIEPIAAQSAPGSYAPPVDDWARPVDPPHSH
ncbi:hypothetical protein [Fodinicola feengrottensis]|uniref:hypothetical protein n=1 Tax=Fodinicola feengrottensis TaxID=435914 RepID=UPI0013D6673C|nr:hypothetical protein [Fodinicola feengrottensis]